MMLGVRRQLMSKRGIPQLHGSVGIGRYGSNNRNHAGGSVVVSSVDYYHVWSSTTSLRKDKDDEEEKMKRRRLRRNNDIPISTLVPCTYSSSPTMLMSSRGFHTTPAPNRGASLALVFGSVALTAKAGQYAVEAYQDWKNSQPPPSEEENANEPSKSTADNTTVGNDSTTKAQSKENDSTRSKSSSTASDNNNNGKKRENFFAQFFNLSVGSKYYEGGFDDKMTKREAALILGVRESSTPKRIKEAHRKLLILNHPDTGGSTYLAGKLNEAKELLLKNR